MFILFAEIYAMKLIETHETPVYPKKEEKERMNQALNYWHQIIGKMRQKENNGGEVSREVPSILVSLLSPERLRRRKTQAH